MLSAQAVAQKWARGMANSSASVQAGVQAVTVSPTQKAAAQINAYVAGVQRAAASGKTVKSLNAVSLQSWQQSMLEKGVNRMASGASSAIPKVEQFMSKWLPYEQGLQQKLASMPRGDIEQNKARMLAAVDYNHQFPGYR